MHPEQSLSTRKETALAITLILATAFAFELFCSVTTGIAIAKSHEIKKSSNPKSFSIMVLANFFLILFFFSISIYIA